MSNVEDKLFWVWLSNLKWFGPVTISNLIKIYKKPEIIFYNKHNIVKEISILNAKQKLELLNSKDLKDAQLIINNCSNKDISIISIDEYPEKLKQISKIPPMLYYKGNLCTEINGIAVTGSVHPNEYSKKIVTELVDYLVKRKVNILSGFKKGIETYVIDKCIEKGGFPIILYGCGLDICYPYRESKLYEKVKEKGLVISQFPPGTKPFRFNIYKSKFLTSAFCDKLVVIDGDEKSDPISTANIAANLKKEIFSVPNNIYCSENKGTNKLIEEGAKIYLSPKQLIADNEVDKIDVKEEEKATELHNTGSLENKIITYLKVQAMTIDEIAFKLNKPTEMIMEVISLLEMDNLLKQEICGRWTVA